MNKQNHQGKKYLLGWSSIILNVVLFVVKYWAGVVSGSLAMIADAWHTLSDSFSSIILLAGVKISSKPPDKHHPFGHGRAEMIASVFIGVMLAIVGFNFLIESIQKLNNHEEAIFGTLAIVVTTISLICKEVMAQFAIRTGKKIASRALIADGWHHRSDAISSAVILVGIFIGKYFWWIDGVLGIIVAVLIFYTSFEIMKDAINPLLGEVPDDELINELKQISNEAYEKDLVLHHLHLHKYGNHIELTFHIKLPRNMPIAEAHDISEKFERLILEKLNIYATIHVDPIQ